jgi:hypothetical protein
LRSSPSACAKKHTRRLQPTPSVHICSVGEGGRQQHTQRARVRLVSTLASIGSHAPRARTHLRAVARGVQPALEHAVRKGAGVLAPAAAVLQGIGG